MGLSLFEELHQANASIKKIKRDFKSCIYFLDRYYRLRNADFRFLAERTWTFGF